MDITRFIARFPERADRSKFLKANFGRRFGASLLDVGCFEAPLRDLLDGVAYTGIDMAGRPDIVVDLDRIDRLPFDDGAFDCVICIEVLEHLDNLHTIVPELFRCARRHVIVSLPNCWRDARVPIARGRGAIGHYGLPVERPLDRHRWFMSFTEVMDFFDGISAKYGAPIVERASIEQPRPAPIRALRRLLSPGARYDNRYVQTGLCVFEKPAAAIG